MLCARMIVLVCLSFALVPSAWSESDKSDPSTADFDFLLGAWRIEAAFGQNGNLDREITGKRNCAFALKEEYIRCETVMNRSSGGTSESVSLHNYNSVLGRYESLYYSSGWPMKVLGNTTIEKDGDAIRWTNNFEFTIDNGRTEWVRAEMTVTQNTIEANEYIKRTGSENAEFNLEYRERWTRISED